jgi:hypothetical protein
VRGSKHDQKSNGSVVLSALSLELLLFRNQRQFRVAIFWVE